MKYVQEHKHVEHSATLCRQCIYEGWNFNCGNYLFTTDTK